MAFRYWVGGSGTWNTTSTTNWSATSGGAAGASVPTSVDSVVFDTASAAGSYTVTISGAVVCAVLNAARAVNLNSVTTTLATGSGSINAYNSLNITTVGVIITGNLNFVSTTTSIIKTSGSTIAATTSFNGVGGEWTLSDNSTFTNSVLLTNGTLKLNVYRLTAGAFDSSNSNARTIDFGTSGVLQVTGAGSTAFNCATSTNLTVANAVGQDINMTSASAKTFAGGSKTWPGIWNIGGGALTITGSNTFNGTFEASVPAAYVFEAGSTQTFTGTLALRGTSVSGVTINSTVAGTQATLSQAAGLGFDATYVTIKDSNATGGQTWNATNSIDSGNNTGWNITAPFVSNGNMLMFF